MRALTPLAVRATLPISPVVKLPNHLLFASDAEIAALFGAASLVLALTCLVMERRRARRAAIDRVGWVPWTGLFLMFAVVGGGLIALGLPTWIRGG